MPAVLESNGPAPADVTTHPQKREKAARRQPFLYTNRKLAVGDVHRYFKAKTHFGEFGFGPHGLIPFMKVLVTGVSLQPTDAL